MKPTKVDLNDYQKLSRHYTTSLIERRRFWQAALSSTIFTGVYFNTCYFVQDSNINDLFDGFGPLASFAQRISIAYALGAIDKGTMDELRALKEIRNHFAHHPTDAKFADTVLDKHFNKLGPAKNPAFNASGNGPLKDRRLIFLFTVSLFVMQIHNAMLAKGKVTTEINEEA